MWTLARQCPLALAALAMFAIDAVFIAIQIAVDLNGYSFNGAYRLSLETEMGVAQFYGWVKIGAAAFLLVRAWRRYSGPATGLWAAALIYLGTDDALRIHERLGSFFAGRLDLGAVGELRGQDLGEAIGYAVIITVALAALIIAERRDHGRFPTMVSLVMTPIVAVFLFFAVVLDTVGHWVPISVEDGGELAMLTVIFVATVIWSEQADEVVELST